MSVRLMLVAHAATAATRRAAFARGDEEVEFAAGGGRAGAMGRVDRAWTSPAVAAVQTAAAFGIEAAVEPAVRDLDAGEWTGRSLAQVGALDPEGLERWVADPSSAPHGGETIEGLLARVREWLALVAGMEGRCVAVTHAAVVRAAVVVALEAPARSFWRVDVAPLGGVTLLGRREGWTVRSLDL